MTDEPRTAAADHPPATGGRTRRSRRVLALVLVGVVGLGLAIADVGSGPGADAAGSILYTAAVYLVLALVRPRAREVPLAGAALAVAVGVEIAQLTQVPAALVELWAPVRLVLGTSFDPRDLVAYGVGAVVVAALDRTAALSRFRPSRPS